MYKKTVKDMTGGEQQTARNVTHAFSLYFEADDNTSLCLWHHFLRAAVRVVCEGDIQLSLSMCLLSVTNSSKIPWWRIVFPWPLRYLNSCLHPKMNILSSFTHLHVVPKPYNFLYSTHKQNKTRYLEEFWWPKNFG